MSPLITQLRWEKLPNNRYPKHLSKFIHFYLKCGIFVKELLIINSQKDKLDSQPTTSSVAENPVPMSSTKQSRKRSHSTDSNKEDDNFDVNMCRFSNDCIIT